MGKCKFNYEWLELNDKNGTNISQWGKRVDDYNMICFLCNKQFNTSRGLFSINQHVDSQVHKKNLKLKLHQTQLKILVNENDRTTMPISLFSTRDAALKAELIWCLKSVSSNMSAKSSDGIVNVFKAMFQTLPEDFSLCRTKLGYLITEALGPHFRKQLLDDIRDSNSYFSILYDETTNNESKKELQIMLRYFSDAEKKVCTVHLETFFLGSATADELKNRLMEALDNAGLSLRKIVAVGSDGPNVNKKVFRLINEDLKYLNRKPLVNIGTCSIHIVHNAFLAGLKSLNSELNNFIISVYHFFDDWPLRCDDFLKIQIELNLPKHRFIKHVSTRWLTIGPAINRILEQYEALIKYFLEFLPKYRHALTKTKHYKDIVHFLKSKILIAELHLVESSFHIFSKFTGFFQREEPLIHILYSELKYLVTTLLLKVLKKDVIVNFNAIVGKKETDIFSNKNLLPLLSVKCPEICREKICDLPEVDKLSFFKTCQNFFIDSSSYLLLKSPLALESLKYFSCLNPKLLQKSSDKYILKLCDIIPIEVNKELVRNEFSSLQLEMLTKKKEENSERIDSYWSSVDSSKYPELVRVIKICLSVPSGNADVERGFSSSARILTEDKTHMSLKTLNARLNIKNMLKKYNNQPELVPITTDLLILGRIASKSYKDYLERERLNKNLNELEMKRKKEREAELKKQEEFKKTQTVFIDSLEKELKQKTEEKKMEQTIVTQMIKDTSNKLKIATEKQDITGAAIAQTMLEGLIIRRQKEEEKNKEVDSLQKDIQKRKSTILNQFVSKRAKTK